MLNVLLDGGSDITLIREEPTRKLGLLGVSQKVVITTGGGGRMKASKRVKMVVTNPERETINLQAWTVPKVCEPLSKIDWSQEKTHLADLPLKATRGRIDLLLGSYHVDAIVARKVRSGKELEPVAAKTRFGWLVVSQSGETNTNRCFSMTRELKDLEIDRVLKEFFATENYGAEKVEEFLTKEEEEALKIVSRETRKRSRI